MSCRGLGLYNMPLLRLPKTSLYRTLDLSDNHITGVESFDFNRFSAVNLRGNPLRSCLNIPLDIVATDSCGDVKPDMENPSSSAMDRDADISIAPIKKDSVRNPATHPKNPVKKADDSEKPVTGIDVVDNRNGKLMVVVVGSSTVGGVGLVMTVIIGVIVHLYKKGTLQGCCNWIFRRVACGRQYRRSVRRIPSAISLNSIAGYVFDHDGLDELDGNHGRGNISRPTSPPPPPPMCTIPSLPTDTACSGDELLYADALAQFVIPRATYMAPQCCHDVQPSVPPPTADCEVYMEVDEM